MADVILWLNGHTHTNTIRPRPDPGDPKRGFWEVTTCAEVDWPCQTRVVELLDHGEYLSIVTTMVDHDTPLAPSLSVETSDDLAALHRELAANVPWDVTSWRAPLPTGTPSCASSRPSRSRACPESNAQRVQVIDAEAVIGQP
ncbi:MAG: hypothetical protein ACLP8X_10020 [Streptosporangiaceae bacterium]